jgi:hypothetical protein
VLTFFTKVCLVTEHFSFLCRGVMKIFFSRIRQFTQNLVYFQNVIFICLYIFHAPRIDFFLKLISWLVRAVCPEFFRDKYLHIVAILKNQTSVISLNNNQLLFPRFYKFCKGCTLIICFSQN